MAETVSGSSQNSAYSILGLHKGASLEEIKQAYVALVKKFDPEKHTDRFMVIQKAFDKLRDPASRAREDLHTFNFVQGEFFFNPDERTEMPTAQIDQALGMLQQKKEAGQIPAEEAAPKLAQGLMMRSFRKVQKKLWAEAIRDWQDVLKLDPSHRRAKNNLIYSFITLGYSYANHGLFDEAVDVWSQAATMNPDSTEILHNLALACERAGRVPESARYWREVSKRWKKRMELEPDNEGLKNQLVELLRQYGDRLSEDGGADGAEGPTAAGQPSGNGTAAAGGQAHRRAGGGSINEMREILKINPEDFEARFKLANMLMREQQWEEAVKELIALRRSHPRNLEVMNLLGGAMLNSGKVDEAFVVWKKALAIEPKNMQVTESLIKGHMTIGRMLRDKALYTPCLVHFKALMRYMPDSDEVHYEIAKTYQLKGDERSAYQEYNHVLKLNPKHKLARNGLSTLKLRR